MSSFAHTKPRSRGLFTLLAAGIAALGAGVAGCGGHNSAVSSLPTGPLSARAQSRVGGLPPGAGGHISHVVVIVQENRSFDSLFNGFAGANYAPSGKNHLGQTITLQPVSFAAPYELCHGYSDALTDVYGTAKSGGPEKMDGFDLNCVQPESGHTPPPNPQYVYVAHSETTHYFNLAKSYSLGDNFFSSQLDGSYIGHQYLIAAQAGMAIDQPNGYPWGCSGSKQFLRVQLVNDQGQPTKKVFPCFEYETLADQLDAKHISWRYYAAPSGSNAFIWSTYDAIKDICGPVIGNPKMCTGSDWTTDVISPQCQVLTDAAAGNLPAVTWVAPNLADSDHPTSNSTTGPKWVTAIVNAIGKSPIWDTTAIFVVWDDWGGFYDHVPPPVTAAKGVAPDWDGPGIRVPLIAISPYNIPGTITHVQYDGFASILKSIEGLYGLKPMTTRDTAAQSLFLDKTMFDFSQSARKFKSFADSGYACNGSDSRPNDTDYGVPMSSG